MSFTSIKAKEQSIYTSTKMFDAFTVTEKTRDKEGELVGQITHQERRIYITRTLQVQESSLLRRIHVLVCSLFHDMWNSLGSSISAHLPLGMRVRLVNKNTSHVDEQVSETPGLAGNAINSTIQSLRVQTEFNSIGVDTYCKKYLSEQPDVQYIPNCLVKGDLSTEVDKFPEWTENALLIPIVLEGFGRDHIVCLYMTRKDDGTVVMEFYDSKGLTIADRANETLTNNPEMTLGKLVAELTERYSSDDEVTIEENTAKHQWDSHNCGIYVCHYFKERIKGTPANEIRANQHMGYDQTFTWRREMVNDLMDDFQSAVVDAGVAQKASADPLIELDDEDEEQETQVTVPSAISKPPVVSGEFVEIPL